MIRLCPPIYWQDLARYGVWMLVLWLGVSGVGWANTNPAAPIYNPDGLFAGENTTGSMAICRAEGNCDPSGNKRTSYDGHIDPGNGRMNYGWCSANTRYYPSAANGPAAAAKACQTHVSAGLKEAKNQMRRAGFDPNDQANAEILINFVDLYNMTPIGAARFIPMLTKVCQPGSPCPANLIHKARVQACLAVRCVSVAVNDMGRRVGQIHSAVTGQNLVLGDVSGMPTGPSTFAELQITLLETVQFLECWSCGIVEAVTRLADQLGEEVFDLLRGGLIAVLAALLGVYLMYHALRVLLPFGPVAAVRGIFGQITIVTGVVLFVMLLLGSMNFYWDYIYRPVLTSSMNSSMAILQASNVEVANNCNYSGLPPDVADMGTVMSAQITCITSAINKNIATGTRVGWAMIVGSGKLQNREKFEWYNPTTYGNLMRLIVLWVSGFTLMGIFIYASLAFLWVVIDIVYRWTFVSIISPLAISAFAFPETRKFSSFALRGLMESFVALILTAVVAVIAVQLIAATGLDPRTTTGTMITGDVEEYIKKLSNADVSIRAPTINTTLFWSLATVGMMVGSLMFKMKDLASYLTSSAIGGWATQTGQQVTTFGTLVGAPLNQVFGRFASKGMANHLTSRYNKKFTDAGGKPLTFKWR